MILFYLYFYQLYLQWFLPAYMFIYWNSSLLSVFFSLSLSLHNQTVSYECVSSLSEYPRADCWFHGCFIYVVVVVVFVLCKCGLWYPISRQQRNTGRKITHIQSTHIYSLLHSFLQHTHTHTRFTSVFLCYYPPLSLSLSLSKNFFFLSLLYFIFPYRA